MPKLYQVIVLLPIILLFTGCADTSVKKSDPAIYDKSSNFAAPIDSRISSTMNNKEKIQYIERLFETSMTKSGNKKNPYLINALYLCSEILLSKTLTAGDRDYTLQLNQKIMTQIKPASLSQVQSNQLLLTTASIKLIHMQYSQAIMLLDNNFNSSHTDHWSLYHKIRAIASYQQGQKINAIQELIFRHSYIIENTAATARLENQMLIWNYLKALNTQEITLYRERLETMSVENTGLSENEQIFIGWLDLANIFQQNSDHQAILNLSNFWLQSYPQHPADRAFINYIIQRRQEAIMDVKHIAILLPMQGKLSKPAKAIRDGIIAAYYNSPSMSNIKLRVYDTTATPSMQSLHQQAITNGADFIIGPLEKKNLKTLLQSSLAETPTLALNNIENTDSLLKSENLFQFGLSPEARARSVVQKGRQDGHQYAVIMVPDNAWGRRMQKAFAQSWQSSGGIIVDSVNYDPDAYDFSQSIKSFMNIDQSETRKKQLQTTIGRKLKFTPRRRQDIDMLFLAAYPKQAKQIPLQIIYHHGDTIPIYSTAHMVSNYHNARQNVDIDGVIFSDMPFLLGLKPEAISTQSGFQNILYERLFAMGVDSYQLAPYIKFLAENPAESFSGDTGQIHINSENKVIRLLPWASFKQGLLKLQNPIQPPNEDISTGNENVTLH